jgi:hypothetical protein
MKKTDLSDTSLIFDNIFLSTIENVSKNPLLVFTLKHLQHSQSPDLRRIACVWLMQCPTLHGEITHHVNGNDFWEKGLDMSIADFEVLSAIGY